MSDHSTPPPARPGMAVASGLTLGAGAIHLAAAPPHFDTVVLGAGFVAVGLAQVALGALLLRAPRRGVVVAALAVHLLALGTLVASRTVGLPIGHGGVEAIGLAALLTGLLELGATTVLGSHLAGFSASPRRGGLTAVVAVVWALSLGSAAAGVTALGTGGHGHDDGHGSSRDDTVLDDGHHDEPSAEGPSTSAGAPAPTATEAEHAHGDDHEHPDGEDH